MSTLTLPQIEISVSRLSIAEQLWLIERMIQRIREMASAQNGPATQLAMMAADPQIQAELRRIEAEFAKTEADGLEGV